MSYSSLFTLANRLCIFAYRLSSKRLMFGRAEHSARIAQRSWRKMLICITSTSLYGREMYLTT